MENLVNKMTSQKPAEVNCKTLNGKKLQEPERC